MKKTDSFLSVLQNTHIKRIKIEKPWLKQLLRIKAWLLNKKIICIEYYQTLHMYLFPSQELLEDRSVEMP